MTRDGSGAAAAEAWRRPANENHYRDALRAIANDGCGLLRVPNPEDPGDARTCREIGADRDDWCWCCIAAQALEEAP